MGKVSGVSSCGIPVFPFIGRKDLVRQSLHFRVLWQLFLHCADHTRHHRIQSAGEPDSEMPARGFKLSNFWNLAIWNT